MELLFFHINNLKKLFTFFACVYNAKTLNKHVSFTVLVTQV